MKYSEEKNEQAELYQPNRQSSFHQVRKSLPRADDKRQTLSFCDPLYKENSKQEKKISFEFNSNEVVPNDIAQRICSCCKPLDFQSDDCRQLYEQASKKGRRGVVLSLEIDQTTSYVTALSSDEHLKFRFQMPNSKHVRWIGVFIVFPFKAYWLIIYVIVFKQLCLDYFSFLFFVWY